MKVLRKTFDSMAPHFEKGGRFEKWYALYEAVDTGLFQPNDVTKTTAHVRDGIDLKRVMITVWACVFPAMFYGMYNLGFQANTAIEAMNAAGQAYTTDWHAVIIGLFAGNDPTSIWDNLVYGAVYFLPIYAVTFCGGRVLGSSLCHEAWP